MPPLSGLGNPLIIRPGSIARPTSRAVTPLSPESHPPSLRQPSAARTLIPLKSGRVGVVRIRGIANR